MIAVVHAHFSDDAPGRVLHFLDVRIDNNRAGRDQCACDMHRAGPYADATCEKDNDGDAGDCVSPDGFTRIRVIEHFHAVAL